MPDFDSETNDMFKIADESLYRHPIGVIINFILLLNVTKDVLTYSTDK